MLTDFDFIKDLDFYENNKNSVVCTYANLRYKEKEF